MAIDTMSQCLAYLLVKESCLLSKGNDLFRNSISYPVFNNLNPFRTFTHSLLSPALVSRATDYVIGTFRLPLLKISLEAA
jgi:hypothetical protein